MRALASPRHTTPAPSPTTRAHVSTRALPSRAKPYGYGPTAALELNNSIVWREAAARGAMTHSHGQARPGGPVHCMAWPCHVTDKSSDPVAGTSLPTPPGAGHHPIVSLGRLGRLGQDSTWLQLHRDRVYSQCEPALSCRARLGSAPRAVTYDSPCE